MKPEDIVLESVRDTPGITSVRLINDVISRVLKRTGTIQDVSWSERITQMVEKGEIIEVVYVTQMDCKTKSLYFPAGTLITVKS